MAAALFLLLSFSAFRTEEPFFWLMFIPFSCFHIMIKHRNSCFIYYMKMQDRLNYFAGKLDKLSPHNKEIGYQYNILHLRRSKNCHVITLVHRSGCDGQKKKVTETEINCDLPSISNQCPVNIHNNTINEDTNKDIISALVNLPQTPKEILKTKEKWRAIDTLYS